MNIKTKTSLVLMYFIVCFFAFNIKGAEAGCCVNGSSCSSASSTSTCTTGSYSSQECSSISTCSSSSGGGSNSTSGSTTISFSNPISATTLAGVLNNLLTNLKSVVIIVAIIFIVIGGLMYMMSGGNEKTITRAKACVGGAIIGLAIVLAAPIFLREVLTIFGGASSGSGLDTSGLTGTLTLKGVATNILTLLLSVLGIIAIISLVVGGGMYLTAYGDEKKIETAKRVVKYAIIGIVIALSAIVIVKEVGSLLGETTSSSSTTTTTTK